jgi:hypothetical protein
MFTRNCTDPAGAKKAALLCTKLLIGHCEYALDPRLEMLPLNRQKA